MKLIILTCIVLMASCSADKAGKEEKAVSNTGNSIIVQPDSPLAKKLTIKKLESELYSSEILTYGIVQAIPNNYAEIASPFAGRITKSFIRLGQKVAIDDPIFAISSPSFFEASKSYYQANQEMQLAEKNFKRQQDLNMNGVGIQKDLEEAEVDLALSKRDYENTIASLHVYKVVPENLVLGQPLIVRSPIHGEVVTNNIVIGQYLKEDADPIVSVADLNKVWIVAQIKEKDINSLHDSEEIEVTLSALSEVKIKGNLYHISELLDEETRSVQAYIECENVEHYLKPGMYASVKFIEKAKSNIIIPSSSVFQDEEQSFVFKRDGADRYNKQAVEITGTSDGQFLLVSSGIEVGDNIVTDGGYYLLDFN